MANQRLRIGIAGCGRAARVHLGRLLTLAQGEVQLVGCADPNLEAAQLLADQVPPAEGPVPTFADHKELLAQTTPDALAIFTPHRFHYRLAMDALQAGCHVFIERPLSTNVQEATDIVNLARGRGRTVGVGHQYRLRPSLAEARRRLADGTIGPLRLVSATLAAPWLAAHSAPADAWRYDPKLGGGGLLADQGDHLIDALLWTTGRAAVEVAAFQSRHPSGLDLVTAAALRLADEIPATLGLTGVAPGSLFELIFFGERGRLHATETTLIEQRGTEAAVEVPLPEPTETIDGNFVAAIRNGAPLCCPADQALDTVRLLEAIARSAATGQVVRMA
ncbi:MAG: Gfo/Idh/MocA family oxidoreductase [Isosphaeraceae bacterium]|nr:Gfo/Idh/MocA family oxidoreductase [Isosphaeraceae bacterium]